MEKDNEFKQIYETQQQILEEINNLKYGDETEPLTFGERLSDKVVTLIGSWKFLSFQAVILLLWILWNVKLAIYGLSWDVYPFILLNLVLSFQAAFTAPIILMSDNRTNDKDRKRAKRAYKSIEHIEDMLNIIVFKIQKKNGNDENGQTKGTP